MRPLDRRTPRGPAVKAASRSAGGGPLGWGRWTMTKSELIDAIDTRKSLNRFDEYYRPGLVWRDEKTLGRNHQRGRAARVSRRRLRPALRRRAPPGPAHHRRAVPHRGHHAAALLGGDQGVPDLLRRGRLERGAQHRAAARAVPRARLAGALSARRAEEQGHRFRAPRGQGAGDHGHPAEGLRVPAGDRAARRRRAVAQEASERVLRHAARQPSHRPRRGHARSSPTCTFTCSSLARTQRPRGRSPGTWPRAM